eukprot:GHVU01034879.1.p2 GENE.GHVU01034879.1~~GHVU01034879.1.p2  ORF type:complete len:162 (-),score=13.35 GHVU01034879.1:180-665(-)
MNIGHGGLSNVARKRSMQSTENWSAMSTRQRWTNGYGQSQDMGLSERQEATLSQDTSSSAAPGGAPPQEWRYAQGVGIRGTRDQGTASGNMRRSSEGIMLHLVPTHVIALRRGCRSGGDVGPRRASPGEEDGLKGGGKQSGAAPGELPGARWRQQPQLDSA